MTYTPEQIELAVSAMEGPRTLANSIWRDAFERDAPAIVKQQQDRIKELETALRFYANEEHWPDTSGNYSVGEYAGTEIDYDTGNRAKAALGGTS